MNSPTTCRDLTHRCTGAFRCFACRAGFTLFELLLVIGLIVLLAAWVAPEWRGQLARQRVEAGAKELRAAWQEARLRAIENGVTYEFQIVPGTGHCRVRPRPVLAPVSPGSGHSGKFDDSGESNATEATHGQWIWVSLPSGLWCAIDAAAADSVPDTDSQPAIPDEAPSEQAWVSVVQFFPQGTATDTSLLIGGTGTTLRRLVILRGITGQVRITDTPGYENSRDQ